MNPVTKEQIDAILVFLDGFEAQGFSAGTWSNEQGMMPYFMLSDDVIAYERALYNNNWVIRGFAWPEWKHGAEGYVASPDSIATAEVGTIQKLFTTHVRQERFCDGHLAAMFENGHIVALLKRLREIRKAMGE